jgi:hypothetical protein
MLVFFNPLGSRNITYNSWKHSKIQIFLKQPQIANVHLA